MKTQIKTPKNKAYYRAMGYQAGIWYNTNKGVTPEFGYPQVWNGLSVAIYGTWKAMAFKEGFDMSVIRDKRH